MHFFFYYSCASSAGFKPASIETHEANIAKKKIYFNSFISSMSKTNDKLDLTTKSENQTVNAQNAVKF